MTIGAKHFIDHAASHGVNVVFISNRSEMYRSSTSSVLQRLLAIDPSSPKFGLYLKDDTSDKAPRREEAAARYNVLMFFGDNLPDFSETFAAPKLSPNATTQQRRTAIARRQSEVDEAECHWGVDWFVLPNPVYGEWEKLIGPEPEAIMRPTSMKTKTLRSH